MSKHLFTNVHEFYTSLYAAIAQASSSIHMAYYAFDDGHWAQQFGHLLAQKAASGVTVHLLIDEAGLYLDNARNGWRNRQLLAQLARSGVQVTLFRPNGRRLSQLNRLHCKFCTIDDHIAFMGGSNIGDHYTGWRDSNLRLEGDLGDGLVQLHRYLRQFGGGAPSATQPTELALGGIPLLLTLPGHRQDIRRALLDLILSAKTAVYLRSWYFLPDSEIMNALLSQAENGVQIHILFSHHTRVPLIDVANRRLCRELAHSGAFIYRYTEGYMHAKEAWNDQNDVLFGSANIDRWAMRTNFECCLRLNDRQLANRLTRALNADVAYCRPSFMPPAAAHSF